MTDRKIERLVDVRVLPFRVLSLEGESHDAGALLTLPQADAETLADDGIVEVVEASPSRRGRT
jgi:hypothetical protein